MAIHYPSGPLADEWKHVFDEPLPHRLAIAQEQRLAEAAAQAAQQHPSDEVEAEQQRRAIAAWQQRHRLQAPGVLLSREEAAKIHAALNRPTLRPPPEHADRGNQHWIQWRGHPPMVAAYTRDAWMVPGTVIGWVTAEEMWQNGYRYLGPADYPAEQPRTDECTEAYFKGVIRGLEERLKAAEALSERVLDGYATAGTELMRRDKRIAQLERELKDTQQAYADRGDELGGIIRDLEAKLKASVESKPAGPDAPLYRAIGLRLP